MDNVNHEEQDYYVYKSDKGEYKLPKEFKDEFNRRLSIERSKAKDDLEKEYSPLKSDYEKTVTEFNEYRKKYMSKEERDNLKEKEYLDKIQATEKEKERGWHLFKSHKSETDIFEALSQYDVYNPKQVVKLLKSEFAVDVNDLHGDFRTIFKAGDKQLSANEAVEMFLTREDNQNLLRTKLKSGAGTSTSKQVDIGSKAVFTKAEITNNPEARKRFNELIKMGQFPEVKE